jgi:hypothetical protein
MANKNDPRRFTTSGGKEIELTLIPPLQAEMARDAAQKEAIQLYGEAVRPTYITAMDETLPHDATTLETDEDRVAWAKYEDITAKHAAHVGQATMRFFLFYGVNVDPDADTAWEKRQRAFKIEIPEDEIERKIHYIQTELIYSRDDLEQITTRLMTLGGVRPEVVTAAASSFRD